MNDFMRNTNKVSLNGEVVSFSDTLPKVEAKEVVVETPIVEESKKKSRKAKKEEKVETVVETNETENVVDETAESTEETTDENADEVKVEE